MSAGYCSAHSPRTGGSGCACELGARSNASVVAADEGTDRIPYLGCRSANTDRRGETAAILVTPDRSRPMAKSPTWPLEQLAERSAIWNVVPSRL